MCDNHLQAALVCVPVVKRCHLIAIESRAVDVQIGCHWVASSARSSRQREAVRSRCAFIISCMHRQTEHHQSQRKSWLTSKPTEDRLSRMLTMHKLAQKGPGENAREGNLVCSWSVQ